MFNAEENLRLKPMEICEETRPTAPMKRKANDAFPLDSSDDIEDGGVGDIGSGSEEQGGKCDNGEESDASSREEGQEWDVDSFDDGLDYKPKRNLDPNDETGQKMHRYRSSMYRSKGFDVDGDSYPGSVAYRALWPIDLDEPFEGTGLTGREYMQAMVDLALERYNRIKGFTVTCESIVRSIVGLVSGIKCYITFMAKESPNGDLVEYQAKTEKRVWQTKTHVIFCRPAPEPKELVEGEYSDTSSDDTDSDLSSRGSGQAWDVDSFDELTDFKTPRTNAPSDDEIEQMRLYRPQMYKTKGFSVDGDLYPGKMLFFSPVDLDEELWPTRLTGRQYMEKMVGVALDKYNEMKEGSNVTLESIVRANLCKVNGFKSYITFMAREVPGGDLVEYQAKVERRYNQRKHHAILCRPTPKSEG